jgi:hypothetical protein
MYLRESRRHRRARRRNSRSSAVAVLEPASSRPPASDSVPGAGAAILGRQGERAEGAGAASELDADHLGEVADRLGAANSPVLHRIPAGAGRVVWRGHLAGAADLPDLEIEQRRAPPICRPIAVVSNSVDSV